MRTLDKLFTLPPQWTTRDHDKDALVFSNALNDVLFVSAYRKPPDIEADPNDVQALRTFYREIALANDIALLETGRINLAGVNAVCTLFKSRLKTPGFGYFGSYTLPFAECSYVIKAQSFETRQIGARERTVMNREGFDAAASNSPEDWECDPYDKTVKAPFMASRADDPAYDAEFPDHPLSRVRGYLEELAREMKIDAALLALPPFVYPPPAKKGFWSRFF